MVRQDIQRDPLNLVLRQNMVEHLLWAQRFEDAQAELDRTFELMAPAVDYSRHLSLLASRTQILVGDFEAAAISAESLPESVERSQLLALAYYALGRQSDSEAAREQLRPAASNRWSALYAAEVHAYRGESRLALEWLRGMDFGEDCEEEAFAQFVYYSPFLAKLEATPGWKEYRSGVLQVMQGCLVGLAMDSD
jgi:hypothetical protein